MNDVRLIAFYLPQFHPIEENDAWWGKGFTEWTNVSSAKPVFPGHYQPHIPADLGFYDLRLAEVREEQARLALTHGIHGFCYYYYYFNGKKLLNRPLDEVLSSGKPDFPFCICWANENWTRNWDGYNNDVLIEQFHSIQDDKEFIQQLIPALSDKRYIRVNNKLLLLVYRAELLPDPIKTANIWRDFVREKLSEDIYLCAVNSHLKSIDPDVIGFDGVVQFPFDYTPGCIVNQLLFAEIHGIDYQDVRHNLFINYPSVVDHFVHIKKPDFNFFRGVFPSWDNTPRRQKSGTVFINSSPELYKIFLKTIVGLTKAERSGDERLVFINAWNEWAEGAHLEPDKKFGLRYLEATKEALNETGDYKLLMEEISERDSESRTFFTSASQLLEKMAGAEEKITELSQIIELQNRRNSDQATGAARIVLEKDTQILQLAGLLEQKELLTVEKEKQFQKKEILIQEKEQQIHQQVIQNRSLKNQIQELEHQALQYDRQLIEKNERLQELASLAKQKEDLIRTFEFSLSDKEVLIISKESLLAEKESVLTEKEQVIQAQSARIEKQSAQIHLKTNEIQRLERSNQSFINSFSWRITKPFRWLHPRMIAFFYLFCPYGSKRWLIVKTMVRILLHPGFYFKILTKENITKYFKILTNANLITYNQRIENQNVVAEQPKPILPERNIQINPEDVLVDAGCSYPSVLFCYGFCSSEEQLLDSIGSIIRNATFPYKIIVVGNPDTIAIRSFQNIEVHSNDEVLPFITKYSTIKYICLLDDVTQIRPETLSACITTLQGNDHVSMVVPGVLNNLEMLDSAGSILWNNGSYSLVGNNEGPYDPGNLYLRETDSGDHFALIKHEVFCRWFSHQHMLFASWPYPLHDISMFIRASHSKVIFQPLAQVSVYHQRSCEIRPEFVSEFYNRWKDQLMNDHFPHDKENIFVARERGKGKQYMLMIDHCVPTFDRDAGSRTMTSYIELFIENNIVLKFIGNNFYPEEKYVTFFQQKGIEVLYGDYYSKNWLQWLKRYGHLFVHVFLSRPEIAIKFIDPVRAYTGAKIFFYGHDLHYLRELRQYELEQKEQLFQSAMKSKEMEQKIFDRVDVIYYPSQAEVDIIRQEFTVGKTLRALVPYIFTDFQLPVYNFIARKDLLFVGGFYHEPNCDAMVWFVEEIFPAIRNVIPGVKLYIAGSHPTKELKSKASDDIIVTGYLSDAALNHLYEKCRLVVAPLRFGAGIKGKIVEAMYHGLPVITTSIGAEGLTDAGSLLTIADGKECFAEAVIQRYNDENKLVAISLDSFEYVKENFSKGKAYSIICQDLNHEIKFIARRMSPSAKILFVSHDAHLGGAQMLLISMLRWFKAHTSIDIRIVCNKDGILLDKFKEIADTMVFSDLQKKHKSINDQSAAIIAFCDGKPDMIYGSSIAAGRSYSVLSYLKVPVITHVHEMQMSIEYYANDFIEDVIKNTDYFIAGSRAVSENLVNQLSIPAEQIMVIHDFIDAIDQKSLTYKEKNEQRKKLGLAENKFIVLGCSAGLFWRKGADLFIETARHLLNSGLDDFQFYWIGSTEDADEHPAYGSWKIILNRVKEYGLSTHITFLGTKLDFKEYFMAGDVFLLPSREDPFPLVCLEAAQLGLPVICFDKAGGMPEFVEQDAGFIIPFEDTQAVAEKIKLLYQKRDLCFKLGQNAKNKVLSKHTVAISLPKILTCCRNVSGIKPAVSIIVPNYNHGKFLEARLNSITGQTFKDFEIIILDDASNDNSLEVIEQFKIANEVTVQINQENGGSVFKQWYRGINQAKSDLVWIAESDDVADVTFLEKMLPLLNDPEISMGYCASHVIDNSGKVIENYYQTTGYYNNLPGGNKWDSSYQNSGDVEINDGLGIKNIIPNASAVVIRRSALLNIDTGELFSYKCAGDWFVYLNILKCGSIVYNANPLNYQRRHPDSVVSRNKSSAENTIPDYFKINKFINENFFLNEITFEKQSCYVIDELRSLWPGISDDDYFRLYNFVELKRCFERKRSQAPENSMG